MPHPVTVIGADVASKRWIAVVLRDGVFQDAVLVSRLTDLLPRVGQVATIAIDIPIGLPVGGEDWPRAADTEAREWIGRRRSSVFLSAPRPVLECSTYAAANALHREITPQGKGLSRQSWALCERILEAEDFAQQHSHVVEVHPEVSFRALNEEPLPHAKKSWNGQHVRRRLLASQWEGRES